MEEGVFSCVYLWPISAAVLNMLALLASCGGKTAHAFPCSSGFEIR
jgi:hypothetical protein